MLQELEQNSIPLSADSDELAIEYFLEDNVLPLTVSFLFLAHAEMIGNKNAEFKVLHIENSVECRIVSRINRFVCEVRLESGYYRAYINNTGRLHQFLVEGKKGFCVSNEKLGRTSHRLFAIEDGDLGAIIDTQLQMRAFEKALPMGLVPWLDGARILKRNAGLGYSLIDYLLKCDGKEIYLEVKSAVLREEHYAMYPDCPSSRGRKHIRELTNYVRRRGEAILLFIAALPRVSAFKPNRSADPELYKLLVEARQVGVKTKSISMVYHPKDSFIYLSNPDLSIDIS